MSATAATGKVVNFTILERELIEIEGKVFEKAGKDQLKHINDTRHAIFELTRFHGHSRLEVARAVQKYHDIYTQSKERAWQKEASPRVMRAVGVDSPKSLYNLMHDAEFVKEHLKGEWPSAFIKCGMDPAARKNRKLILQFEERMKGKQIPADETEAEKIAKDAIDEHLKQKKKRAEERRAKAKDPAVFRRAMADRLARFMLRLSETERQVFVDGIAPEVWACLNALKGRPAKTRGSASVAAKPASRSKLAVVPSPTRAPALPPQLSTAEQQPTSIQPGSKPALVKTNLNPIHPWGDQCLDTLELLGLGPRGVKQGRFNRDQLYEIRETRTPTRYLIGGLLDLFKPGLDKYIGEHLDIFEEAYWHRFLVMTPHVDRVQIQSDSRKAITRGRGFPLNLWIGTTIECPGDLWRLRTLHKTGIVPRWVSFAGYRSDRSRPLSTSTFMKDLEDCAPRLVVIGWDLANAPQDLTIDDACTLANAASHFGSIPFFHTHPGSRNRFLHGQTPALAPKSIVQDRSSAALIESAEQLRRLPDEWLRMPFPPKNMKFEAFKGPPVEVFQLRP